MTTTDDQDFHARLQRVEVLLQQIESSPNTEARARTHEIVQGILELHSVGLARIVELITTTGATGSALIEALTRDDLARSLLLLHGLHPETLETRVTRALEAVRPSLRAHGTAVELLNIVEGRVRLRMSGGAHAGAVSAIEAALYEHAPDVAGIEIEGSPESNGSTRIALPVLPR